MNFIKDALEQWLKEILVSGILSNLTGLFDNVNTSVGEIATQVGMTPQGWNAGVYNMIRNLSTSVIIPIAGLILAFVMTYELIHMIIEKNNLHGDVDTFMFFKWMFKTAGAILILTNTWTIIMGIFEAAQSVVNNASGIVVADTNLNIDSIVGNLEGKLLEMDLGKLFSMWLETSLVGVTIWALNICIFVIVYGRMIEVYLVTSIAPIPMATMLSHESGNMGQNYLRSLFALAFQAFLILVCVAIYAVLVGNIGSMEDISAAVWTCVGYTVLLCFTLFKTGSLAKSIFNAH